MKKHSRKNLPRPVRTCCWLILLCLAILLVYAAFDFPLLTARMAFRQAEKDQMVGPGNILATFRQEGTSARQVTVAETDTLYLIHSYQTPYCHQLNIYEKTDSMAFCYIPEGRYGYSFVYGSFDQLGLVLFDHCPEAEQVSVEFRFMYDDQISSVTANSRRAYADFFVLTDFRVDAGFSSALDALGDYFDEHSVNMINDDIAVTVQFYDAQGTTIRTEQTILTR